MQFCSVPKCKNVNFGIDKLTRLAYCSNHQYKRTDLDRRSIAAKAMSKRDRATSKLRSLQDYEPNKILLVENGIIEPEDDNLQELWYKMQMASNLRICDNCGLSLQHYNDWAWRSSQNHIVDKSPVNGCPSVATHPLNCNVLGMWCCHGQWGTSFLNQSKMPCFPSAKERFLLFKSCIDESELKKVNPYLL